MMNKKFLIIIFIFFSIFILADEKIKFIESLSIHEAKKTDKVINLLVAFAKTPAQWQKGLMKIKEMKENQAMLFIFPKEDYRVFWMKDTYIALDLIFLDKNLVIIGIVRNNQPMSEKNIKIDKKAMYVLEVNAGFTKKYDVKVGDRLLQNSGI